MVARIGMPSTHLILLKSVFFGSAHSKKIRSTRCVLLMHKRALFCGRIAEICAIRSCFRELVGRGVANGLLDLIGRLFSIGIIEHICHSFWQWREIRPILSATEQ